MADSPFLLTPEEQEAWERAQGALLPGPQALRMPDLNAVPGGGAIPRAPRPAPARPVRNNTFGGAMGWNDGSAFAGGGFNMAQAMAGQQGSHLAGMINQVQNAIADENDSRVSQERERRRQEHEKELLRIQQEYALQRLREEREAIRQQRIANDRASGVLFSSTWAN